MHRSSRKRVDGVEADATHSLTTQAKLSNLFHAIENRGALDAVRMRDAAYAAKAAAALARGDNIAARVSQSVRRARRPSEDRTNDVLEAFDESTGPFSPRRPRGNSIQLPAGAAHLRTITPGTFPTE